MTTTIWTGDCRDILPMVPNGFFNSCITSPPYFGLRDYGHSAQIGLEKSPDEYVASLVMVFREIRRALRDDGTLWLNLGDSYSRSPSKGQHKPGDSGKQQYIYENGNGRASGTSLGGLPEKKNLLGIPWRVAFALQADGWILRSDIIWAKPNPMPNSQKDRVTTSHEYIFMLTKSGRYYFDHEAIKEPCVNQKLPGRGMTNTKIYGASNGGNERLRKLRNQYCDGNMSTHRTRRSVWNTPVLAFKGAHFATFPPELIEPCVLASSPAGGLILDPFGGAGTTGVVAEKHGRNAVLIELNPTYAALAQDRLNAYPS